MNPTIKNVEEILEPIHLRTLEDIENMSPLEKIRALSVFGVQGQISPNPGQLIERHSGNAVTFLVHFPYNFKKEIRLDHENLVQYANAARDIALGIDNKFYTPDQVKTELFKSGYTDSIYGRVHASAEWPP